VTRDCDHWNTEIEPAREILLTAANRPPFKWYFACVPCPSLYIPTHKMWMLFPPVALRGQLPGTWARQPRS